VKNLSKESRCMSDRFKGLQKLSLHQSEIFLNCSQGLKIIGRILIVRNQILVKEEGPRVKERRDIHKN